MGTTHAGLGLLLATDDPLADKPLHGRSLRGHSRDALHSAGLEVLDDPSTWSALVDAGVAVVVHDPLCPLTPAAFISQLLSEVRDEVLVGFRPVTDTIKRVTDGVVGATMDRSALVAVTAPVVLPPSAVAALQGLDATDLPTLVQMLRDAGRAVRFVEAPAASRRVVDRSDVVLLEAMADAG